MPRGMITAPPFLPPHGMRFPGGMPQMPPMPQGMPPMPGVPPQMPAAPQAQPGPPPGSFAAQPQLQAPPPPLQGQPQAQFQAPPQAQPQMPPEMQPTPMAYPDPNGMQQSAALQQLLAQQMMMQQALAQQAYQQQAWQQQAQLAGLLPYMMTPYAVPKVTQQTAPQVGPLPEASATQPDHLAVPPHPEEPAPFPPLAAEAPNGGLQQPETLAQPNVAGPRTLKAPRPVTYSTKGRGIQYSTR